MNKQPLLILVSTTSKETNGAQWQTSSVILKVIPNQRYHSRSQEWLPLAAILKLTGAV